VQAREQRISDGQNNQADAQPIPAALGFGGHES
jgi:hypothetical protein